MLRIGAHMSVAGGIARAVERARVHGCEALQIFTKNSNQWRGKPLDRTDIAHLDGEPRVGICLDTCHLLAGGYDIVTHAGYEETMTVFDRLIGFDRLRALYANDSKKPRGSRVDRHEHIGAGHLGEAPFHHPLHDARLRGRPLLIETEKSRSLDRRTIVEDPLDARNLATLKRLRDATG